MVEIEFIVDIRFEVDIALPPSILSCLDAVLIERRIVLMPDGREGGVSAYEAEIKWDEDMRRIEITELAGRLLLGMLLLNNSHLHIEDCEGGEVIIEPL